MAFGHLCRVSNSRHAQTKRGSTPKRITGLRALSRSRVVLASNECTLVSGGLCFYGRRGTFRGGVLCPSSSKGRFNYTPQLVTRIGGGIERQRHRLKAVLFIDIGIGVIAYI